MLKDSEGIGTVPVAVGVGRIVSVGRVVSVGDGPKVGVGVRAGALVAVDSSRIRPSALPRIVKPRHVLAMSPPFAEVMVAESPCGSLL